MRFLKFDKTAKDRRTKERRKFASVTRFPLRTQEGNSLVSDRRRRPTRRLNDIEVREISYQEFFAALRRRERMKEIPRSLKPVR
jgi:hypothetical protein